MKFSYIAMFGLASAQDSPAYPGDYSTATTAPTKTAAPVYSTATTAALDYGDEQPDYGDEQPDYGDEQPDYGDEQPDYGDEQPDYGDEQAASTAKPSAAVAEATTAEAKAAADKAAADKAAADKAAADKAAADKAFADNNSTAQPSAAVAAARTAEVVALVTKTAADKALADAQAAVTALPITSTIADKKAAAAQVTAAQTAATAADAAYTTAATKLSDAEFADKVAAFKAATQKAAADKAAADKAAADNNSTTSVPVCYANQVSTPVQPCTTPYPEYDYATTTTSVPVCAANQVSSTVFPCTTSYPEYDYATTYGNSTTTNTTSPYYNPDNCEPGEYCGGPDAYQPYNSTGEVNGPRGGTAAWKIVNDPSIPRGHFQVNVKAADIVQDNKQSAMWVMHEAQTPAAQQLAQHLNTAAQDMSYRVIAARNNIQAGSMDAVSTMAQYLNPSASCNAKGYLECYSDRDGGPFDITKETAGYCETTFGCANQWQQATSDQRDAIVNKFHASEQQVEAAVNQLGQGIKHDARHNLKSQTANAQTAIQDFLTQAKKQYIAWGCNTGCIDNCTASIEVYKHCDQCACTKSAITISGNRHSGI